MTLEPIRWGVEVEVETEKEGWNFREINDIMQAASAVEDGSLRCGVELVFGVYDYIPDQIGPTQNAIYEIRKDLVTLEKNYGATYSPVASTHLNVSWCRLEDFSHTNVLNLLLLWTIHEREIIPLDHNLSSFCIPLSHAPDLFASAFRYVGRRHPSPIKAMLSYLMRGDRYKSFVYRAKEKRFEIRHFRTEVPLENNIPIIESALRFASAMMWAAKNYSPLELLSLEHMRKKEVLEAIQGAEPTDEEKGSLLAIRRTMERILEA